MSDKIDLKATLKNLYAPSAKEPSIVDVPAFNFLKIDGHGNPNNNPVYQEAVSTLYSLAYGLKFSVKKAQGIDYAVMPLEGLWWAEDMDSFLDGSKDKWLWTMIILQPEYVTAELVEQVRAEVQKKKNPPRLNEVRFEPYAEGTSVQIMHLGPYATEHPNIMWIHRHALEQGYHLEGLHHEIYLTDPNRTAPEKNRTVLRQPVRK